MYKIDTRANSINRLESRTFNDLGFKERNHLQEWIAKASDCLGEELLVIQKEFAGFSDTHERLDLLALDKEGSLVLIENKLDDTGRDVTWQALKYASYCSRLTKDDICRVYQEYLDKQNPGADARGEVVEFLGAGEFDEVTLNSLFSQRIMLVAADFRKEVTSTVLWLLNFKLRIQCFRVTPYSMGDQHFLTVEQIIPIRDAEDFMIGLIDKTRNEIEGPAKRRDKLLQEFWGELLRAMSIKSDLFQNISAGTKSWLAASAGVSGVKFTFHVSETYARAEVGIWRAETAENKSIFDALLKQRGEARVRARSPPSAFLLDANRTRDSVSTVSSRLAPNC